MHITIFEEKDFTRWCQEEANDHKESIFRRACIMLLSMTTDKSLVRHYGVGEPVLFDNLNRVEVNCEFATDSSSMFNTCLIDKCFSILYDDIYFNDYCKENRIDVETVKFFFDKLSNYVTDAVIVEWKLQKGIQLSFIKVENPDFGDPSFFPVSYHLSDLILVVERLTGKIVKFTPYETLAHTISKEEIWCYFCPDRLESEYLICEQLLREYLKCKNFMAVDKTYFNHMNNWKYDEEHLKLAINIIVQNRFINLLISQQYPIYTNHMIYSLVNFKISENYMNCVCRFLCGYSKASKFCRHCSGIDEVFSQEGECPLYKDESIMDRFFYLDELMTPEQHIDIVNELIEKFTSK